MKRINTLTGFCIIVFFFVLAILFTNNLFSNYQVTLNQLTSQINNRTLLADVSGSLSSGLVGYWPLDGNANDVSGNGNNGTLVGNPTFTSGVVGSGAVSFNGTNQITVPDSASLNFGTGSFTVSLWVNAQSAFSTQSAPIYKRHDSLTPGYGINFGYKNGFISDGSSTIQTSFSSNITQGTWQLLTLVVDRSAGTAITYVNGAMANSKDISSVGSVSNSSSLQIGMGSNWLPFTGSVDDARIYNRALSSGEIESLYSLGNNTGNTSNTPSGSAGNSVSQTNVPTQQPVDTQALTTPTGPTINGSTSTAYSCSQFDVQAAVNAAVSGGTVYIPAGNCTWGDGGSGVNVNKAVTVQGAGQGVTNLTISPTASLYNRGIFNISAPATIRDLTVEAKSTGSNGMAFNASANGFRITNVKFIGANGYFLYGGAYGLVDHDDITAGGGSDELIFVRGPANSWQTSDSLGTADNLFIEDSTFNGSGYVTDCNSNSRCVVRFNIITGNMKIDAHGKASNSPPRGVREMEIYDNTWTSLSLYWAAIELRGGTGMVFDNKAPNLGSGVSGAWVYLTDYGYTATWTNFGSAYQCLNNYPVDDQIGVGKDPKTAASDPYYVWNNIKGGSYWPLSWKAVPSVSVSGCSQTFSIQDVIKANRDYYISSSTPFDGTSGVGVGTLANRSSTCTPGVGYWATDQGSWNTKDSGNQGELYKCTSVNTWSLSYVPYKYPYAPNGSAPVSDVAVSHSLPPPSPAPITPSTNTTPSGGGGGNTTSSSNLTSTTGVTSTPLNSISGCGTRTTGFSLTTGQSCGQSNVTNTSATYNFGTTTLKLGSTGVAVKELQRFLNDKLNLGLVLDGKLGSKTVTVIKKLQSDHNLVPDGLVGQKTKLAFLSGYVAPSTPVVSTTFTTPLKPGSTSSDVKKLQIFLNKHGFIIATTGDGSPGHETTFYSTATAIAVSKFQKVYALQIGTFTSGTFDLATLKVANVVR